MDKNVICINWDKDEFIVSPRLVQVDIDDIIKIVSYEYVGEDAEAKKYKKYLTTKITAFDDDRYCEIIVKDYSKYGVDVLGIYKYYIDEHNLNSLYYVEKV